MRISKLDAPHVKERVTKELATGRSQRSIAREIGLHPSQVSRFANREDIKMLIEEEAYRLFEAVPDAVQNVIDLVAEMKTIPENDTKRLELSFRASLAVLKAAGMLPTSHNSQTFINLYNQTNAMKIDPIVKALIEQRQKDMQLSPEDLAMLG